MAKTVFLTKDMPQSGQFVTIWEYNNTLWSETRMWEDGELKVHGVDVYGYDFYTDFDEGDMPETDFIMYIEHREVELQEVTTAPMPEEGTEIA